MKQCGLAPAVITPLAVITSLALKWRKTVKALGVHFSYNNEELVQKNFYDKLGGLKSQIRWWSWRGLSLIGKVTIIKSLLLPKVLYVSLVSFGRVAIKEIVMCTFQEIFLLSRTYLFIG